MKQYIYKVLPSGQKRTNKIVMYAETEPLIIGHEYIGNCKGQNNQTRALYRVVELVEINEF